MRGATCSRSRSRATALSSVWWGSRLADVFRTAEPHVVLACQRRAGALESAVAVSQAHVEVIRFRCVGQIDAGMLLDLMRLGARRVLVAGCSTDRCRFDTGASLAAEQTERARAMLELLGEESGRLAASWSRDRAEDPLDGAIRDLVATDSHPGVGDKTVDFH